MDKKRILVVDDEENIRLCISIVLKMNGYETICLDNGEDALKVLMQAYYSKQKFDLLICDIQLPKISGEEVIDKINSFKMDIPFLMISGYGDKDHVIRFMRKGCRDFIDKPFDPEELEKRVESIFSKENQRIIEEKKKDKLIKLGTYSRQFAHDLNNILCATMGYADVVRDEIDDRHPIKEKMDKLVISTSRAAEMCKSMLTFNQDKLFNKVEVGDLIHKVSDTLRDIIAETIEIDLHMQPIPIWCSIDSERIKQALINLGINAAQAMPGGGHLVFETESIEINGRDYVQLSVTDNGKGIAPNIMKKIFEDGFSTKEHGYGIGLSTVKMIVEEHCGRIDVQSELGIGTVFTITLPIFN